MNRIIQAFNRPNKSKILSIFFTAGYPQLQDTRRIIESLESAGADMIEIGIPFSDPVADGPTIQESSEIALSNGMTLKLLLEQLEGIRETVTIPLLLMGYLNPVIQYGMERFCETIAKIGIDGLILPDLPIEEYLHDYKSLFEKHHLSNILLVTPETSDERIRLIDEHTNGFIYAVSSSSTTGKTAGVSQQQTNYFQRLANYQLRNPHIIGFGISDRTSFEKATQYADGAIIGSAFIKQLKKHQNGDLETAIHEFIRALKN